MIDSELERQLAELAARAGQLGEQRERMDRAGVRWAEVERRTAQLLADVDRLLQGGAGAALLDDLRGLLDGRWRLALEIVVRPGDRVGMTMLQGVVCAGDTSPADRQAAHTDAEAFLARWPGVLWLRMMGLGAESGFVLVALTAAGVHRLR